MSTTRPTEVTDPPRRASRARLGVDRWPIWAAWPVRSSRRCARRSTSPRRSSAAAAAAASGGARVPGTWARSPGLVSASGAAVELARAAHFDGGRRGARGRDSEGGERAAPTAVWGGRRGSGHRILAHPCWAEQHAPWDRRRRPWRPLGAFCCVACLHTPARNPETCVRGHVKVLVTGIVAR